jgi:hypothetical protein
MSMKERARNMEKKVGRGSKTAGRDMKKGMSRAGAKIEKGAKTAGRDVKRAGKRVESATRHGMTRVRNRLRPGHKAKLTVT